MIKYNIELSQNLFNKINKLSISENISIASIFRKGICLLEIAVNCKEENNRLCIFDAKNNAICEIVGIFNNEATISNLD